VVNVERDGAGTPRRILLLASRDLRNAALRADSTFRQVSSIAAASSAARARSACCSATPRSTRSLVETNVEVQALLSDIRQNPRGTSICGSSERTGAGAGA
jgi:hypothetical protein